MPVTARRLAPSLGAVFRVGTALEAGHTVRRMRATDLEAPFHGVRRRLDIELEEGPPDDEPLARDRAARAAMVRDAEAFFAVAPAHTFLAGRSAAVAWSLPCDLDADLWVGVVAPARAPRRPNVRGVKVAEHLATIQGHDGFRVTDPSTTWAMLGGELTHRELVILGDAIVRVPRDARGRPQPGARLATIAELRAAAAPGRPHRGALVAALADIRVGSMSPLETDYRMLAAGEGLPEAVLDVEIRDAAGMLLGISDAVYPDFRTIVEVEGDHHRTSRAQWDRDIAKYAAYAAEGWEVARLTSDHVRGAQPKGAQIVASVLRRRGWRG